jgi:hypothetical protein
MDTEMCFYTIYAKENLQTAFEITTAAGEILELDYPCWVYFVNITDKQDGKYLIVKASNGNILEVNTKNDKEPDELEEWRFVEKNDWFTYSLSNTLCQWGPLTHYSPHVIIINSNEELEQYINCAEGNYPEVDFSKYSLLFINANEWPGAVANIHKNLLKISENEYKLNVELILFQAVQIDEDYWNFAIVTSKLSSETNVELNVSTKETTCQMKNLNISNGELIIINSNEELENYLECTDHNDFPEIDFSRHTLLLADGAHGTGIQNVYTQLIKTGENAYDFNVHLLLRTTTVITVWMTKTLIAKLPSDAVISLKVHKL